MNLHQIIRIVNIFTGPKSINKSPGQLMIMLHQAQVKHFYKIIGSPQDGKAVEIDRLNSISLSPFKVYRGVNGLPALYIDRYGIADSPEDLFYPLSALYGAREVEFIPDGEYSRRKGDALLKGTLRNPVAVIQDGYIEFDPLKNMYIKFSYLKNPPLPVYGYTQTRGFIEYQAEESTELLWKESDQIEIIYTLISDLGIDIGKQAVIEMAEKVKSEL